jgi:hypothetical protein
MEPSRCWSAESLGHLLYSMEVYEIVVSTILIRMDC